MRQRNKDMYLSEEKAQLLVNLGVAIEKPLLCFYQTLGGRPTLKLYQPNMGYAKFAAPTFHELWKLMPKKLEVDNDVLILHMYESNKPTIVSMMR